MRIIFQVYLRFSLFIHRSCPTLDLNLFIGCLMSFLFVYPTVAIRWDSGGRVPSAAHAAAAGIRAAECLSEQNKDAHRHATRERDQRPGAEGVYTESTPWAEGKREKRLNIPEWIGYDGSVQKPNDLP